MIRVSLIAIVLLMMSLSVSFAGYLEEIRSTDSKEQVSLYMSDEQTYWAQKVEEIGFDVLMLKNKLDEAMVNDPKNANRFLSQYSRKQDLLQYAINKRDQQKRVTPMQTFKGACKAYNERDKENFITYFTGVASARVFADSDKVANICQDIEGYRDRMQHIFNYELRYKSEKGYEDFDFDDFRSFNSAYDKAEKRAYIPNARFLDFKFLKVDGEWKIGDRYNDSYTDIY